MRKEVLKRPESDVWYIGQYVEGISTANHLKENN